MLKTKFYILAMFIILALALPAVAVTTVKTSDEVISSLVIITPEADHTYLAFVGAQPFSHLSRLMFAEITARDGIPTFEPKAIFSSLDPIEKIKIQPMRMPASLLVSWETTYTSRSDMYHAYSLDGGKNFSHARLDTEGDRIDPPQIREPLDNAVLQSSALKIIYAPFYTDPLLCTLEISSRSDFSPSNTWRFEQLISPLTQETAACFPSTPLPEGNYYVRVSASNGITTSLPSPSTHFSLDNTPPEIISCEAERKESNINFVIRTSEPARIYLDSTPLSPESSALFQVSRPLTASSNRFSFLASDEAGNVSITTKEVFLNLVSPEISVSSPRATDWFRAGSAVIVEAQIWDMQKDIAPDAEPITFFDNQPLENALAYDAESSCLSGLVALPPNMPGGQHTLTIKLKDMLNNEGQTSFPICIDDTPPVFTPATCFTPSNHSITLPLLERDSGIDPAGTIVRISGVSLESSVSVEGSSLSLSTGSFLLEGSYEAQIIPRDRAGNTGEKITFCIVVDTTPPLLSAAATSKGANIIVQGTIDDKNPAAVKIYNNGLKVEECADGVFADGSASFTRNLRALSGKNALVVEAIDQAGNKTSVTLDPILNDQAAGGLITDFCQGPNPFNPTKKLPSAFSTQGNGTLFSFALAKPADIKIRIYDITGTLIWCRDIPAATSGVSAWSGVDQFGSVTDNGIYPYIFSAAADGMTDSRKGKIVILK
jgi:hypothetical protein